MAPTTDLRIHAHMQECHEYGWLCWLPEESSDRFLDALCKVTPRIHIILLSGPYVEAGTKTMTSGG